MINGFCRNRVNQIYSIIWRIVRYNIMKCQAWLLVIEGFKTFVYLLGKQKHLEKDGCGFLSHFH